MQPVLQLGTLCGQSQTVVRGLKAVPGPQSITKVPPFAHWRNFLHVPGWGSNPVKSAGHAILFSSLYSDLSCPWGYNCGFGGVCGALTSSSDLKVSAILNETIWNGHFCLVKWLFLREEKFDDVTFAAFYIAWPIAHTDSRIENGSRTAIHNVSCAICAL